MSILDLFRPKIDNRGAGTGQIYGTGRSTAGTYVTQQNSMQITAVYACVRVLSESLASLPLHIYRYSENGNREKATDHPLYFLLHHEPNPEMSSFTFRETLMTHLLLWGNAYVQIIRDYAGRIQGLYILMPGRMQVKRDSSGGIYYQYQRYDGEHVEDKKAWEVIDIPRENILHIPGLGFDGLVGYSPIAMARNSIGASIACDEYAGNFFNNGASPSGILEHPGTLKDPEKVRNSWNKTFGGVKNSGKVAVLEEGMKYQPVSLSPEQAQFLQTRKFQINEIARIFRVPPHMIGDLEHATFSNIEQQSLEFVKYTLEPWVIRWEQEMERSLLNTQEKRTMFIKFNLEGLLRGDYQSRMNGYAIARQNGWISANDIRTLESMDPIAEEDGGDLYLINGNMMPLNQAGSAYKGGE